MLGFYVAYRAKIKNFSLYAHVVRIVRFGITEQAIDRVVWEAHTTHKIGAKHKRAKHRI